METTMMCPCDVLLLNNRNKHTYSQSVDVYKTGTETECVPQISKTASLQSGTVRKA